MNIPMFINGPNVLMMPSQMGLWESFAGLSHKNLSVALHADRLYPCTLDSRLV